MESQFEATLAMWEKREMPKRKLNKETKEWEDTGEIEERTIYTFRSDEGSVLKLYCTEPRFRELEGSNVIVSIIIQQTEFQGKSRTQVKITNVEKSGNDKN